MLINFLLQFLFVSYDIELVKLSARTKYVDGLMFSCLQIAPIYLTSCTKQGMALLEILLYKLPIQHNETLLKVIGKVLEPKFIVTNHYTWFFFLDCGSFLCVYLWLIDKITLF